MKNPVMRLALSDVRCGECLGRVMFCTPNLWTDPQYVACENPECVQRGKKFVAPLIELEPAE